MAEIDMSDESLTAYGGCGDVARVPVFGGDTDSSEAEAGDDGAERQARDAPLDAWGPGRALA